MTDFIINDSNYLDVLEPVIDGHKVSRGCTPRDLIRQPVGSGSASSESPFGLDIDLIPRSEWSERIKDKVATKTQLSDIRNRALDGQPFPALDQKSEGYCWAYSTVACVMLLRASANMPYVQLSPHAVACKIMNFRDRGAWGALSFDFIAKNGVPSVQHWPANSMRREHDNEMTWDDAKQYRISEGWIDLDIQHASDADLTFDQIATLLLTNTPVVLDFDWWGHSVCGMDLVEVRRNVWGIRILNSWGNRWGNNGAGVIEGRKAIPMGACAPRAIVGT